MEKVHPEDGLFGVSFVSVKGMKDKGGKSCRTGQNFERITYRDERRREECHSYYSNCPHGGSFAPGFVADINLHFAIPLGFNVEGQHKSEYIVAKVIQAVEGRHTSVISF